MVEGKSKDQWVHTTSVVMTLLNINRDPKSPPVNFDQLYPYAKPQQATAEVKPEEWSEERRQYEREMSRIELKKAVKQMAQLGGSR